MKLKKVLQSTIVLLATFLVCQSVQAITVLGENPFYSGSVSNAEDVRQLLVQNKGDVKEGLMIAGNPELFEPLFAQLQEVDINKVVYGKGQKFEWMFYRKKGKGKVRVDKVVIWESDEPLESYQFYVDAEDERYTLTVPPACGNLALLGKGPIPVAPPPPVVPVESSGDSGGGSPGSGPEPEPEVAVAPASTRLPILVDAGYLHLLDPGDMAFARIGLEYPFNENFSLIGMVGGVYKYGGRDGDDAFIADVFANYRFSRFFVGLGLGAWISAGDDDLDSEDNDLDLILNFGARLFGDPDAFNTSLFFEVRSAVDEMDDFDLYGRVGAGLRFSF